MRVLMVLFLTCLLSVKFYNTSYAEDKCREDPRECFDFNDDDSITTNSGKAERTFSFPPVKTGFVFDFRHRDITPHLSVEVVSIPVGKLGDLTIDGGIAASRLLGSITLEFLPIIKAGPNLWVGYNVKENDIAYGIGVSFLAF